MFFLLSKILWWAVKPSSLLILLLTIGMILTLLGRRRAGRALLWAGALGFVLVAMFPVDEFVLMPLEQRFPAVRDMPARLDGIVVLGGAVDPVLTTEYGMPSLNDAAERMTTFVKLARTYPKARLIFSGGSGSLDPGVLREADVARQLLGDLGLDTSRVTFERESRNTYENAIDSKRLMNPEQGESWALITSALHMPRAVGAFRRAGWSVVPWPVGYKAHNWGAFSNIGLRLTNFDSGVHEWIGLIAYRLADRSDSFFPAP